MILMDTCWTHIASDGSIDRMLESMRIDEVVSRLRVSLSVDRMTKTLHCADFCSNWRIFFYIKARRAKQGVIKYKDGAFDLFRFLGSHAWFPPISRVG